MAATQRKLVHKQFNSPMGLYSAQNVKETLHRELKAFGGDGIEVDESLLKPSNLANSAVLKALEEEENEQYGVHHKKQQQHQETNKNTRESRPRKRIIVDRDTVLKINRHGSRHRSRDHSWPPPPSNQDRSPSASDEIHFDEKVCKQHRIDGIAKKFDHGEDKKHEVTHHKSSDALGGDMSRRINERGSHTPEWPPIEHHPSTETPNTESIVGKNFCLPADVEHLHVGIVQPMKQYFEEIAESNENNKLHQDKPWGSSESLYQPTKPASHFISRLQTASLDRYICKRQLPPPKPRSRSSSSSNTLSRTRNKSPMRRETKSKSPTDIATTIWPSPSSAGRHSGKSVTIQLPSKGGGNEGNKQMNNVPMLMNNNRNHSDTARPAKPAAPRIIDCSRKNMTNPARRHAAVSPCTSTIEHQDKQHSYQSTKNYDGNLTTSTAAAKARPIGNGAGHRAKLNRRSHHTSARPQLNAKDTDTSTCIRSIDLIDDSNPQSSTTHPGGEDDDDEEFRSKRENIAPPPQDGGNKTLSRNENKFQKDTLPTNGDKCQGEDTTVDSKSNKSPSESETKHERRKGIYYTDGEYLFGPFANADEQTMTHDTGDTVKEQPKQQQQQQRQPKVTVIPIEIEKSSSDGIEISTLEQKCGKIQKSITEDLRQIDRYMMQAKMALNRLQEEHEMVLQPIVAASVPKIVIVETPLQAMIRRVFPRPTVVGIDGGILDCTNHSINQAENVPVVEQALQDLSNLAAALADDDDDSTNCVFLSTASPQPSPQTVLVDITEVDSRSQSSLSEATTATANSPYTVTDSGTEEGHTTSNPPRPDEEIVLSKNILSGYIITKKDQEELLSKATAQPQTKITDTTAESPPRVYDVENVTGHSKTIAGRWQLALETKQSFPEQGSEHNSINNKECAQSKIITSTRAASEDAPPPPPPPPPPPCGNNLKYHVNGLHGHDVGLMTTILTANDVDVVVVDSTSNTPDQRPGRARNRKSGTNERDKVRSLSQPPPLEYMMELVPSLQSMTTSTIDLVGAFTDDSRHNDDVNGSCSDAVNRKYNNVSPCLYFPGPFHATSGYKRVAWPPVTEGRTIREFTPQPSPQPPYQQGPQPQQQQQQQPNYQQPGASPVQASNQGGHYIQSQPNYQSSYPNQQQQQQEQPSPKQEPYYLQQRSPQPSSVASKPSSTVTFSGGVAQPVYNTPKPTPQAQYQYPPQSQPQQQQQQLYQPPLSPEPQQQYYQQQQYQPQANYPPQQGGHQQLDEPSRGRWGHVASPIPQRSGYVQNYQSPLASPAVHPPFSSEPQYGPPQQQNIYGATSVPQVNQSYDRQPSYGPPQQQRPVAPAPIAPATAAPQQYYQAHQQPQPQQYSQTSQPIDNQYNYYSQPEPQQQQHQQLQQQQHYRGESPGIITLRKEAPITQQPAPVYASQPAAASFAGGATMRGDLKWPPPEYKEAAAVENEERRRVAQGPATRPRRINKDYTQFFAKNALSHHYPSYKVPPGTQHMYGTY